MKLLGALALLTAVATAAEPAYLDEGKTKGLVSLHARAKHWALRGMVLVSLGPRWHKSGAPIVTKALRSRDPRERAYGLEVLRGTDDEFLRRVADRAMMDALMRAQGGGNKYFADRVRTVLARIAPTALAKTRGQWTKWWKEVGEAYEPARWVEPPPPKKRTGRRKTVAEPFLKRAFDLQADGLEMVICIDTTSSMQPAIDAARDAVDDVVTVLTAIAPDFRLGLVHYRDDEDLEGGAQVLSKLTRQSSGVRRKLAVVKAVGGGDFPERVEKGLALAFSPKMGWKAKANKVVVIVGDAPPKSHNTALRAVRKARASPLGKTPVTGRAPVRPFVVAAITVGDVPQLAALARAGGGAVAKLPTRRNRVAAANSGADIVRHLLVLAFGKRWEAQVGEFLRIFNRYRRNGFIR